MRKSVNGKDMQGWKNKRMTGIMVLIIIIAIMVVASVLANMRMTESKISGDCEEMFRLTNGAIYYRVSNNQCRIKVCEYSYVLNGTRRYYGDCHIVKIEPWETAFQ